MTDLLELGRRGHEEFPPPTTLPKGHYKLAGNRIFFRAAKPATADKKEVSAQVLFTYKAVEPSTDVDPEDLDMLPDNYSLDVTPVEASFWLSDENDFRAVWTHLGKHAGFDANGSGLLAEKAGRDGETYIGITDEVLAAFQGAEVYAELVPNEYQNKKGNAGNIARNFVSPDEV